MANKSKHSACGDDACPVCGSKMEKHNLGLSELDYEELVDRGVFTPVGDDGFLCDLDFMEYLEKEARRKRKR